MSRLPVCDVFVAPAYRNVKSEEGDYEAFCGYNLVAKVRDKNGCVSSHIYTNGNKDGACFVFPNHEGADLYAHLVERKGSIDADKYWVCVGCSHPDDLPDYVTDPYRAEFN